jgi:hypothetical protein
VIRDAPQRAAAAHVSASLPMPAPGLQPRRHRRTVAFRLLLALAAIASWPSIGWSGEELFYVVPPIAPHATVAPPAVADGDSYWIVSTRRAPQHRLDPPSTSYDYFRRQEDGMLVSSNAAAMQAEFQPGVPVIVFVHGSFVAWHDQLDQARTTNQWIKQAACGRPIHVVFFDWPSDGPYTYLFPVDVTVRGERAEFNGLHLACVMSLFPAGSPVCLVGHSHGARTVLAALHLVSAGSVQNLLFYGDIGQRPLRAVLAAAAVDHNWLNPDERFGRSLCRSEVMNLRNRCDSALTFYPLSAPFTRPSLANVGFTDGDREDMGILGYRAIELDVTELVGRSHTWPHYDQEPAIATAIAPFALFTELQPAPQGPQLSQAN